MRLNEHFKEKLDEALSAVLPVTIIVLILSVLLVPMEIGTMALFIVGAILLMVGMGLFALGADMAMLVLGDGVGVQLSRSSKLWLVILLSFTMGFIITISEPDLTVLAAQVPSIPSMTLILTIAIGVGIFLVVAILRILFRVDLNLLLIVSYAAIFLLSTKVPTNLLAVAFDSGGVTTGPITVPFIMAMGLGLASIRSDKNAADDSFGLVALCSVGPILAVMLLGIFGHGSEHIVDSVVIPHIDTTRELAWHFIYSLPHFAEEVFMAFAPLLGVFTIFEYVTRRFKRRELIRMIIGFAYTYFGLVLFLTGVNVGFISVGHLVGFSLAKLNPLLLIIISMIIAYFMVAAEPAVHVLNKQVEEISEGAISRSMMLQTLSLGVAVSIGLSMLRVVTGISIYWLLVPGYLIAVLMTFFVPKIFVGIAFDSGGVASGPMATTFLLPLSIGACEALGGNVMIDAFGTVAMVAMTPLIAIQIMGLVFTYRLKQAGVAPEIPAVVLEGDDDIITIEDDDIVLISEGDDGSDF